MAFTTYAERTQDYFRMLRKPFTKICRLRFLQPDGSTAFALDNNPLNRRSGAFLQDGSISVNLQNGQRRTASVTLSNIDAAFDYSVNKVWFGQQIAIDEGLILSDGSEYYLPQGIFYIAEPQETLQPNLRTITYPLVDKWAYLDGTLFGRLEGTYEVPVGTNIFAPIRAILKLDRGNGTKVDAVTPIFTTYYDDKTQTLPDGSTASLVKSPYTLRVDSDDGTYADVILGLSEMVNGLVGYDQSGALRIDPSQDDVLDAQKPVLWRFSTKEAQLLGATYTVKNTEVYNDYIVLGEQTSEYAQAAGRAQNLDPASDTNVYIIGRKTYRETASGYYTQTQCKDLAEWKLKRTAVLQKAVSISCTQMFHIVENNLIELTRTDKPGSPTERHLIQGFTRPLTSTGEMTISAVSVADFPIATITGWPE
nr:MAG TPA: tail protein [Caudoviricetes sp.]